LIVDALPFFWADECRADHLPHSWDVTSDSLAVRAATLLRARKLVLLKSVTWHGEDWGQAAQAGVVDAYLVQALRQSPSLRVRLVNLRTL
jgi:hypothetical protein